MFRTVLGLSGGVLSIALNCACSSSFPRAVPAPASPPALPAASPTSHPSPPNRLPDAAASQTDVDIAMRKRGYQLAILRGKRVYCRNEMLTGSNLATKICQTAEQIDEEERAGREILLRARPDGCQPTNQPMKAGGCE